MSRLMSAPMRIVIHTAAPPLAMEFAPRGSAAYLRLSHEPVDRTVEVEDGVLADYDGDGALVGFELLGLQTPGFVEVLDRLKERFQLVAPALRSIEAVSA
jgi:uncharacterized protein YuzE